MSNNDSDFEFVLKTPAGDCHIQAESIEHLLNLAVTILLGAAGQAPQVQPGKEIDIVDQLLIEYREFMSRQRKKSVLV